MVSLNKGHAVIYKISITGFYSFFTTINMLLAKLICNSILLCLIFARIHFLFHFDLYIHNRKELAQGAQWLSGRVLDTKLRGRGFEPHRCYCVVSLSKNINPSLVLLQPRKTHPCITEKLLMGRKGSNKQTRELAQFDQA